MVQRKHVRLGAGRSPVRSRPSRLNVASTQCRRSAAGRRGQSECSEAWYRVRFGTERSRVQIPPLRLFHGRAPGRLRGADHARCGLFRSAARGGRCEAVTTKFTKVLCRYPRAYRSMAGPLADYRQIEVRILVGALRDERFHGGCRLMVRTRSCGDRYGGSIPLTHPSFA